MIAGFVNAALEATIRLTVRGPSGRVRRIRAVIDTGFDGYLSLTPTIVAELELVWRRTGSAILGDGSETDFEIFDAAVVWDRRNRSIWVDEADTTPLVGTALLAQHELQAAFKPGGKVRVKALR
jgi:clan AA aspartic protease